MRILMSKQGTGNPPTGLPVIDGAQIEDSTLTANVSGVESSSGINNGTYQWYKNGIPVSTSPSVLLGDSDVGAIFYVNFTYTNGYGSVFTLTSDSTSPIANVNDVPVGVPTITGTAEVGNTVSVNTSGISDADGLGTFSYQWLRNGSNIAGATTSSYTLVAADSEQLLSVKVSWTDGHGTAEYVTSATSSVPYHFNETLKHTIESPTGISYQRFGGNPPGNDGRVLSSYGSKVAVGFPTQDTGATDSGAVYCYNMSTGALVWSSLGTTTTNGELGFSVAMGNSYTLVGQPSTPGGYSRSFIHNNTTGSTTYTYNGGNANYYGRGTAMGNGEWALSRNGGLLIYSGSALRANISTPSGGTGAFARRMSMSDNYLAAADPGNGNVYIYKSANSAFSDTVLDRTITSGGVTDVKVVGSTLFVGRRQFDSVLVYDLITGSLIHSISQSANNSFGESVDVYGNFLIVGASEASVSGTVGAGKVYVYSSTDGFDTATLEKTLTSPLKGTSYYYGQQVTITSGYISVGEPGYSAGRGRVHFYTY